MASLVGLTVAGCEMFCGVSLRSAPVAVGLSVKLNVTAGKGVSIVSRGSTEKRELLNEFLIYLYLLCKSPGYGLFCL